MKIVRHVPGRFLDLPMCHRAVPTLLKNVASVTCAFYRLQENRMGKVSFNCRVCGAGVSQVVDVAGIQRTVMIESRNRKRKNELCL